MKNEIKLETAKLILRNFGEKDIDQLQQYLNSKTMAYNTLTLPIPYERKHAVEFIESCKKRSDDGTGYCFAIDLKENAQLIGGININLQKRYKLGKLSYWITKKFQGNGYATEAAGKLIEFGFEELNLNKIEAQYFHTNPASGRVVEKLNMKFEGNLRQHVKRLGEYRDLICCGMLKEEYFESKK